MRTQASETIRKAAINDCEYFIRQLQSSMIQAIHCTPTGKQRNMLTEANVLIAMAKDKLLDSKAVKE